MALVESTSANESFRRKPESRISNLKTAMTQGKRLLIPPFIKEGDTIGIAAPASLYQKDWFEEGLRIVEGWGFRVRLGRKTIRKTRFLAGPDQERADELMEFFADPEIKAVLCARGGYGAMRILERLDYRVVRRNPKMFFGFSDITVLLLAFYQRSTMMTFHGPMVTTLARTVPAFRRQLRATLLGILPETVPLPPGGKINGGRSEGILLGGNLTLITHLIGTPFEPDWNRAVLFLEDDGEQGYRLDRLLFHLRLAGILEKINGLLFGQFNGKAIPKNDFRVIREIFLELKKPIWQGLPVGHGQRNLTLPVGAPVHFDGDQGKLCFL
jgi:muramoyltetrapeptide carboxypeptidase